MVSMWSVECSEYKKHFAVNGIIDIGKTYIYQSQFTIQIFKYEYKYRYLNKNIYICHRAIFFLIIWNFTFHIKLKCSNTIGCIEFDVGSMIKSKGWFLSIWHWRPPTGKLIDVQNLSDLKVWFQFSLQTGLLKPSQNSGSKETSQMSLWSPRIATI